MQSVSVVIITKNEERNIKRCVTALVPISNDIIVVDSLSTDNTVEIATALGCRVKSVDWQGYSKTKNQGNALAKHDYILSIDADEVLSDELAASILGEIKEGLTGTYSFNRLTNYCGTWIKHSGWYPDVKLRLFPKKDVRWEGDIHETLVFDQSLENKHLSGDLLHYSYYSYEDHRLRADKYSALTAEKMHRLGKTASPFKPFLSAFARFISMYFFQLGILDGKMGFMIAWISAKSNHFKYKELRKLNRQH